MWDGKYSETITPWHSLIFLSPQRAKQRNFHKDPHVEPQSPPASTPTCPVHVPSFQHCRHCLLSLLLILLILLLFLLSAFSTLSPTRLLCLKSKLPTHCCLSPEAVIDWLTKREGAAKESEPGQREKTTRELVWTRGSISVFLEASLLGKRRPGHTGWDDEWIAEELERGRGVRFRLRRPPLICQRRDWDAAGPIFSRL